MSAELIYDLDEATYHADPDSLSASGAKVLLGKRPPAPSDALSFGTLVHVAILEPERLGEYVALNAEEIGVKADGTPAAVPTMTVAWKKAVAEATADGKTVIADSDLARAKAMAAAALAHPTARHIIEQATGYEVSGYADHGTGAKVRARYDILGPIIADIKTTRDGNPQWFGKTAADYGYHISAANYLDIAHANGLDPAGFRFINIEKEPTLGGEYRVSVTELTDMAIDLGRRLMHDACELWLALGRRIDLPSYGDDVTTCDLPFYAYDLDELEVVI